MAGRETMANMRQTLQSAADVIWNAVQFPKDEAGFTHNKNIERFPYILSTSLQ